MYKAFARWPKATRQAAYDRFMAWRGADKCRFAYYAHQPLRELLPGRSLGYRTVCPLGSCYLETGEDRPLVDSLSLRGPEERRFIDRWDAHGIPVAGLATAMGVEGWSEERIRERSEERRPR